jgi:hypothetical protein
MLQGIKNLFGPLLDELDCVSAFKEAIVLQVEPACDGPASRDQEAVRPSAR